MSSILSSWERLLPYMTPAERQVLLKCAFDWSAPSAPPFRVYPSTHPRACGLPVIRTATFPSGRQVHAVEEPNGEIAFVLNTETTPTEEATLGDSETAQPPDFAHFLLRLFLPQRTRGPLIGDLFEEYEETILPTFGRRAARFWFWKQTMTSLIPIVRARALRLATLGWLIEWMRHTLR